MSQGMTLKQAARARFYSLCERYREARRHIGPPAGSAAFVALSVQVHAAKGSVPRRLWPLVNRS